MLLPPVFPCHSKTNDILVGHFGYDSFDVLVFMHTDCRLSHYLVRRGRLQVFALTESIQKIEGSSRRQQPWTWSRPPVVRCTCQKEAAEKDRELPSLVSPQSHKY